MKKYSTNKDYKNQRAFTIVELMIIVTIIGILATLSIRSTQNARSNTIKRRMDNNARIVANAVDQWAIEKGCIDTNQIVMISDINPYIRGGTNSLKVGSIIPAIYPENLGEANNYDGPTMYGEDYPE